MYQSKNNIPNQLGLRNTNKSDVLEKAFLIQMIQNGLICICFIELHFTHIVVGPHLIKHSIFTGFNGLFENLIDLGINVS